MKRLNLVYDVVANMGPAGIQRTCFNDVLAVPQASIPEQLGMRETTWSRLR